MSIFRTILPRPRRSANAERPRQRGRHALVATVLLGVSACTAVAADGLPDRDDGPDQIATDGTIVDRSESAAEGARAEGTDRTERPPRSASAAGKRPERLTNDQPRNPIAPEAEARTTAEPTPDSAPEAAAERGTIVAHATAPNVVARRRPTAAAEPVTDFANPTDRGGPLVFQGLGEPKNGWLEVLLPVRPNGTTGWVALDDVTLTRNPYRIEVDLERYELTVRRHGEVEISAPVAVGQGGTPTPIGDFYLIELLQPPQPNGPYGSYAYGLSGYSDVLDNFNGGEGVIGIHGTNRPDLLGGPASHGCIRIHNDTIELMAGFLPLGTPVSILEADTTA